jgi:Protein of unknown function/Domain of unknown function (DUF1835)
MNLVHIMVGNAAEKNLQEAQLLDETLAGNIIVLKDTLGIGPLAVSEGQSFSQLRTQFWQSITPTWPADQQVQDAETIAALIENLQEDTKVWFWMAPCITDVCAYYWLLPYFEKLHGVLHCISINSLPFFNEKGTLFYPKNFSEILPKEIVKCKRLAKDLSPADYELEGEEWARLTGENALIRTSEGGKKVSSKNDNFYDSAITNQLQFTTDFIKAHKIISQAMNKITDTVSDNFIIHRLKTLVSNDTLLVQGDINKALNNWEVKKN